MVYLTVALALGNVWLAIKMMYMRSDLTKHRLLLKVERKKTTRLAADYADLTKRADERIKQLKGRVNVLLQAKVENSEPGDMLDALNGLRANANG